MNRILAPTALFLGCAIGLYLDCRIVGSFAYLLGWWPYIMLVDAVCAARGYETIFYPRPLSSRTIAIMYFSVALWAVFELYNLRIQNWHYVGVPSPAWIWMPATVLAYATVMPGILVTMNFIRGTRKFTGLRTRPFNLSNRFLALIGTLGAAFTLLPITQPEIFFPFTWGGLTLLLEPFNHRDGDPRSVLRQATAGRPALLVELLVAGFFCGFLWEVLNFWAIAKWRYTVPIIGDWKIFEMPVVGYLGFPVFAVEAYVTWIFCENRWRRAGRAARGWFILISLAVIVAMLRGLAVQTIRQFNPLSSIFYLL